MNWYEEATRHQDELRQEAAEIRAARGLRSWETAFGWVKRLAAWNPRRQDHHADVRPAVNPVPDAFRPVDGLLAHTDGAEALVEVRGSLVAHDHAEAEAAVPGCCEPGGGGAHEQCPDPAAARARSHMERLHPRVWVVQGVEEREAEHHVRFVDGDEEGGGGETKLLA